MKKLIFLSITCLLLIAGKAQAAGSSTLSIEPAELKCAVGQKCTLEVSVNTNGNIIDAVRLDLDYPAGLVQLENATRAAQYTIVSGGNYLNNELGMFSYGLGVPGGTATSGRFLSLQFKGVEPGEGEISLNSDSMILADGVDVYDGGDLTVKTMVTGTSSGAVKTVKKALYPEGTLVRGPDRRIYMIINGARKYMSSLGELKAQAGKPIINIDAITMAAIPLYKGQTVVQARFDFGDGNLLRSADNRVYLIGSGKKQYISSITELKKYAGTPIINVSAQVLDRYPLAKSVTLEKKPYNDSFLLRDAASNRIYNIRQGAKVMVASVTELKKIKKRTVNVSSSILDNYPLVLN